MCEPVKHEDPVTNAAGAVGYTLDVPMNSRPRPYCTRCPCCGQLYDRVGWAPYYSPPPYYIPYWASDHYTWC